VASILKMVPIRAEVKPLGVGPGRAAHVPLVNRFTIGSSESN